MHAGDRGRDELTTLVKEIAMQVAAASPAYVSRDAVPADVLEKEKSIYRAQMENSGKPANVIDKIIEGKLGSFYEQVVLPGPAVHPRSQDDGQGRAGGGRQGAWLVGHGHALRAAQGRGRATAIISSAVPL